MSNNPPRHPSSSDATPPEEGNISAFFVREGEHLLFLNE